MVMKTKFTHLYSEAFMSGISNLAHITCFEVTIVPLAQCTDFQMWNVNSTWQIFHSNFTYLSDISYKN